LWAAFPKSKETDGNDDKRTITLSYNGNIFL
jgi:hypothetical protein